MAIFGLSLTKTKKLRNLMRNNEEMAKTIDLHSETIGQQRKDIERLTQEVADLTPKRDSSGRFISKA